MIPDIVMIMKNLTDGMQIIHALLQPLPYICNGTNKVGILFRLEYVEGYSMMRKTKLHTPDNIIVQVETCVRKELKVVLNDVLPSQIKFCCRDKSVIANLVNEDMPWQTMTVSTVMLKVSPVITILMNLYNKMKKIIKRNRMQI